LNQPMSSPQMIRNFGFFFISFTFSGMWVLLSGDREGRSRRILGDPL
jgi:hypothetical protein